MKIGLISDLHIQAFKKNSPFLKHIFETMENFYDLCKKKKVKEVFILGDTFHVKNQIELDALSDSIDFVRKYTKIYLHRFLVGNHDRITYENNVKNFTKIFASDADVIEDYKYIDYDENRFHFMPYFEDHIIKEKLNNIKYSKNNYLFGHFAFKGFNYDSGHEDIKSELSPEDINKKIKHTFSGHYHEHQSKNNVTYISSPMQHTFGDSLDKHGFIFIDSDSPQNFEFIENDKFPKFMTFELNKTSLKKIKELKSTFLRIIIKKDISSKILDDLKLELLENNHAVKYVHELETKDEKFGIIENWDQISYVDNQQILDEYVDKIKTNLDKKKLIEYIK